MCFQTDGKSAHAAQCAKSRVLNKVIDIIFDIHFFEHKCVIIKGFFQYERLKQHMVTIGVDQSFSKSSFYKHRYLENIYKVYQ